MVILKTKKLNERFLEYSEYCFRGGYIVSAQNEQAFKQSLILFYEHKAGVILMGKYGSGKSIIFEILRRITHPQSSKFFRSISCIEAAKEFSINGHESFDYYKNHNIIFDDLGKEDKGLHYGDKVEVMEKYIQYRYDLFISKGLLSHFTTNLNSEEIKERYGKHCYSRLIQICEPVLLGVDENYFDNRQLKNFIGFPPVYHEKYKTAEELKWEEGYKKYCLEMKNLVIDKEEKKIPIYQRTDLQKIMDKLCNLWMVQFDRRYLKTGEKLGIRFIKIKGQDKFFTIDSFIGYKQKIINGMELSKHFI